MRRGLAAAIGIAGALSCGRGSGCAPGERSFDRLDAKVDVELVRRTRIAGGKLAGPVSSFFVKIHTEPAIEIPVPCEKVRLAENEAGTLVGFRCEGEGAWTVVRLRGGREHLVECDAGKGEQPAFGALAPVAAAAEKILACPRTMGTAETDPATLVRAVETDSGAEEAASLLFRISASHERIAYAPPAKWDAAVAALSPAAHAGLRSKLCAALEDPKTTDARYARAARVCPHDRPAVASAAAARLSSAFEAAAHGDERGREPRAPTGQADALAWAAKVASSEAGPAACRAYPTLAEASAAYAKLAAEVVARTGAPCPALAEAMLAKPCRAGFVCDGGPCSEGELRAKIAEADDAGRALHDDVVALAVLRAGGPLPPEVTRRTARYAYGIEPDGGPPCAASETRPGAPCACDLDLAASGALCDLPLDGGVVEPARRCAVRADDAKKKVVVTRAR